MSNTVQQIDVVPDAIDENNPFENAFVAQAVPMKTEKQARAHLNLETARTWKIINPNRKNAVGEPVGYKFMPGDNCFPLASKNAWWRKRAGFVDHHVWVTPYREDERFALATIRIKAAAVMGCRCGRNRIDPLRTPTWSFGTPLAIHTFLVPKTIR